MSKKFIRGDMKRGTGAVPSNRALAEVKSILDKSETPYIEDLIQQLDPSSLAVIVGLPSYEAYSDEAEYKKYADRAAEMVISITKKNPGLKHINYVFAYPNPLGILPGVPKIKFFEKVAVEAASLSLHIDTKGECKVHRSLSLPAGLKVTWSKHAKR